MFRLLRLKPPHGWSAVLWDLAIVTLGVLIALAGDRWAEERTLHRKVEASKAAIRDELSNTYAFAVEYRTTYPCVQAQVHQLLDHVVSSGPDMDPVPIHYEQNFHFVVRSPSKTSDTAAWNAAVNDGLMQHFEPSLRRELVGLYSEAEWVNTQVAANDVATFKLIALTHRVQLEPAVRYSVIEKLEELSGQFEYLDNNYGQLIYAIRNAGMLPPSKNAEAGTEKFSGTYLFCKTRGLPMRSFKEAAEPVAN